MKKCISLDTPLLNRPIFRRSTKVPNYAAQYGGQTTAKMCKNVGNSRPLWNNSPDASAAHSKSEAVNLIVVFIY